MIRRWGRIGTHFMAEVHNYLENTCRGEFVTFADKSVPSVPGDRGFTNTPGVSGTCYARRPTFACNLAHLRLHLGLLRGAPMVGGLIHGQP